MGSVQFSVIKRKNARLCGGHPQLCHKDKLVLKNESYSFLDIAMFEDKLETEWKHDMLKLSNMTKIKKMTRSFDL